jgi:hypothetical protein
VIRTHVSIGRGLSRNHGEPTTLVKIAFGIWIASISFGAISWIIECFGPESGSIRLIEDKDGYQRLAVPSISIDRDEDEEEENDGVL